MCRFFEGMVKLGWTHQVPSTSKYHILIRVISIFLRWFFFSSLPNRALLRTAWFWAAWLATEHWALFGFDLDFLQANKFCVERLAFAAAADNRRATDCEALWDRNLTTVTTWFVTYKAWVDYLLAEMRRRGTERNLPTCLEVLWVSQYWSLQYNWQCNLVPIPLWVDVLGAFAL